MTTGMSAREIADLLAPYLDGTGRDLDGMGRDLGGPVRDLDGTGRDLGGPGHQAVREALFEQLRVYLELLLKWNARTNLTAIREPAEMVRRHFGESLFAARHLPEAETLLDFGSGAGFPGLPIQLYRPGLRVTLAESQNKKATFLREVARTLGLGTEIWGSRVEAMAAGRQFDVVTLRAVDHMEQALAAAEVRARRWLVVLTTGRQAPVEVEGFELLPVVALPGSTDGCLLLARRLDS